VRERKAKAEAEKQRRKAEAKRRKAEEKRKRQAEEKRKKEEEKRKEEAEKIRKAREKRLKELKKKRAEEAKKRKLPKKTIPVKRTKTEVSRHLKSAQDHLENKDYVSARAELEKAYQTDPSDPVARNLMAVAVEGEFAAHRKESKDRKLVAQMIEEERMRDKFLGIMDRIDTDISELISEGNRLYRQGELQKANQKYRRIKALETERRMITEDLLERLEKRDRAAKEAMSEIEREQRIKLLVQRAEILASQERWDEAAEKYEAVFLLDPLNQKASKGIDELKKRFLDLQKQKAETATKALEEDFRARVEFYIEEAKASRSQGETKKARILIQKALALDPKNRSAQRFLNSLPKTSGETL
jgi:tetratricopeptide (TPR) repeat protein